MFQSSCTIDVTYFPFDQQTCIMKFGSWTFNGDQVSLALYNNKNFVDLSDYWKSGTWDIIEVPAYLNIYEGNHPTETDITFYIIIRRKTLFYTVNLILPTVLISFLCVLVFYLPAEAGEKVTDIILYAFITVPLFTALCRHQHFYCAHKTKIIHLIQFTFYVIIFVFLWVIGKPQILLWDYSGD